MSFARAISFCSVVFGALGATACGPDDPAPTDCPAGSVPAFMLTISTIEGALPPDTLVSVRYGGGVEEYSLQVPPSAPEVVFCGPTEVDAGTRDAGATRSLTCELWTNGPTQISVTASGFEDLQEDLAVQFNSCGIETRKVSLVLRRPEAGVP